MQFQDNAVLGLDIGLGSVGWALVRVGEDGVGEIVTRLTPEGEEVSALGVRAFPMPEDPKTKELLNQKRRSARMQRRVIRRRAQRMRAVRSLLEQHVFACTRNTLDMHQQKGQPQQSPWQLRVQALERCLSDKEFALVLIHIAKHRGFRSNSKRDKADNAEGGKMLKATGQLEKTLQESGKQTVAVLLVDTQCKRNRAGADGKAVYEHTMLRKLLEKEIDVLFAKQQELGNSKATPELHKKYADLAFNQRPLQSSADLVGKCTFIETEVRAPRFAPTSERFRLAAKLVTLTLIRQAEGKPETRRLAAQEVTAVLELLGTQAKISFTAVRKALKLPTDWRFEGLGYGKKNKDGKDENPEKADVATRTGECGAGSYALCKVLGEQSYTRLMGMRTTTGSLCLDALVKIFSDNDDTAAIEREIAAILVYADTAAIESQRKGASLSDTERASLMQGLDAFAKFKGTMHLSLKAMECILPHLIEERSYDQGCALAGFDHAKGANLSLADVRNPLMRRIMREVKGQVQAITREFGVIPGKVHVEMARDVGKNVEERNKIDKGIKDRTEQKNANRDKVADLLGISPQEVSTTELMRYELWKQQNGKCAYYMLWRNAGGERFYGPQSYCQDGGIPPSALRDGVHSAQIDHILPRSRTQDNSFHNLCLCTPAANQNKGNRTPYEWTGAHNAQAWHEFTEWVAVGPFKGFKKRNFLMQDLSKEKEERFCERNLNDTRYACRLVLQWLQEEYTYWQQKYPIPTHHADGKGIRRVFARPGAITDWLRKSWGLHTLKKDATGKRIGDRHHALDAFITACCTESMLQKATKLFQQTEAHQPGTALAQPMPACRDTLAFAMQGVFVSRAERGKTKGPLHEETLRAIREEKDEATGKPVQMLYKRKAVTKIEAKNLDKIKDAERCPQLIKSLEAWLEQGKPKDALPYIIHTNTDGSTRKDYIRRVQVQRGVFSSGVTLQRGLGKAQADNGKMVRTDVFCKGGKYYLVPVYTWQVAQGIVPDRIIKANTPEEERPLLDASYTFCFALYPDNYVLTQKGNDTPQEGYFTGTHRAGGKIALSLAHDREEKITGIGVQRLTRFEKYRVDRMGRLHRVRKEKRPGSRGN